MDSSTTRSGWIKSYSADSQHPKASMGFLRTSLSMLPFIVLLFWLPMFNAQAPGSSTSRARALDSVLQDYAYRAFVRPRTGVTYDGVVPSNLTGIKVSAVRLRSGSLWNRGVQTYKEFDIPMGLVTQPYVERLVLVYQNLGNWSTVYYPLPGYTYLAPVLGVLAYDASNLSAKNLNELEVTASDQPISITFANVKLVPGDPVAKCVSFDLNGSANFSNVISGNICSTFRQGHFSIVVESTAPTPSPSPAPPAHAPPPPPPPSGRAPNEGPPPTGGKKNSKKKVWIIAGSVVGGVLLLALLAFLALWVQRYKQRKRMQQMEKAAEVGEALHMTSVGSAKAPVATVTRTQPTIENEYVP